MSRLYLPVGAQSNPYPNPQTERESLLARLWKTRTLLPGANITDPHSPYYVEIQVLRDYVQAQECKITEGYYGNPNPEPPKPVDPDKHRQDIGALKEYLAYRRRKEKAAGLRP